MEWKEVNQLVKERKLVLDILAKDAACVAYVNCHGSKNNIWLSGRIGPDEDLAIRTCKHSCPVLEDCKRYMDIECALGRKISWGVWAGEFINIKEDTHAPINDIEGVMCET